MMQIKRRAIFTDNKKWTVYVHINKINSKVYVGITSKEKPEHRWNGGRGYSKNPRFYSAILKYGWDGFSHIILYSGLDEESAKDIEKHLIKCWNATDNRFGYNISTGGEGTPGVIPSKETREKLSKARLKENLSEETLRRRSDGLKGRKFSKEHKEKIGLANSKPIEMYSKDGELLRTFSSASDAENELHISHSHISQCCNGKRNTAGGYVWKFAS